MNFILGFGWSMILLQESITSVAVLVIVSVIIGLALVAAVMYLFKLLAGMQQSGNINLQKAAAGCEGKVYLTIPAARSGMGKVQITIAGAVREYDAVTESEEALKTGTPIRVVDTVDASTVLVEEINSYTLPTELTSPPSQIGIAKVVTFFETAILFSKNFSNLFRLPIALDVAPMVIG